MRVYISPIALGIMVSLLILYVALVPIMIHQYRKYGTVRTRGNLVFASFVVYIITAWFMTILPLPSLEAVRGMKPIQPNFRLFLLIESFMNSSGFVLTKPGTWFAAICSASFYTVAFNVVLTIPFGVYLRTYFKLSLPRVAAFGLLLSLFYEFAQYTGLYGIYPQAYRFADVDDLIVNTLGAVVGYFLAGFIGSHLPDPAKDHEKTTLEVSALRRLISLLVDSIAVTVLFELGRVVVYWNTSERMWDTLIFLASVAIVFLLLPLLAKRKQTLGMLALKLSLQDEQGQYVKTSKALLHNLFAGMWFYSIWGMKSPMQGFGFALILLQILFLVWLFVLIVKSLSQKRLCCYWEPLLDTYLKVQQ